MAQISSLNAQAALSSQGDVSSPLVLHAAVQAARMIAEAETLALQGVSLP